MKYNVYLHKIIVGNFFDNFLYFASVLTTIFFEGKRNNPGVRYPGVKNLGLKYQGVKNSGVNQPGGKIRG